MKKLKKLSINLSAILLTLFCISFSAFATGEYNVQHSLTYASQHWNDKEIDGPDQTLCAGFVSHCLTTGGLTFSKETDIIGKIPGEHPRILWSNNVNGYIYHGCWGLFHDLSSRSFTEVYTLTKNSDEKIEWTSNVGRVSKGDVIFYHTIGSTPDDTDQYTHVVIVSNDSDDKYVQIYAHNNPRNNEILSLSSSPSTECICIHFK